jgi:hypothetical protein
MAWMDAIDNILNRYTGAGGGAASAPADAHEDFRTVAEAAPRETVTQGLSQAFRSDQTPSFGEMVGNLFRQSNPDQKAGLLNHLLGGLGPGALAAIPGLGGLLGGGQTVTPQQATQVSPEQVQQAAAHAERNNPTIVDQVSGFYAQHPDVVKALGGMALAIAIQHMARRR